MLEPLKPIIIPRICLNFMQISDYLVPIFSLLKDSLSLAWTSIDLAKQFCIQSNSESVTCEVSKNL